MTAASASPATLVERYDGWMPVRTSWGSDGEPRVEWAWLGARRFTDPFLHQTVSTCLARPFSRVFRHETPFETLAELSLEREALPLGGFVAHVSRCGSTLLSQALAASGRYVVLSEPDPLDALLRRPDRQTVARLRQVLRVLGTRRHPEEERVFVKLDAWWALRLDVLEEAFGEVPWVVVTRDPVEVLVSQHRHPGAQMSAGPLSAELLGLEPREAFGVPPDEHVARVLGAIAGALADRLDARALVVSHEDLLKEGVDRPLGHLGVSLEGPDGDAMRATLRRDAKNPSLVFEDDRAAKRSAASDRLRRAAATWAAPAFARLEEARRRQRERESLESVA